MMGKDAAINHGLRRVAQDPFDSPIPSTAPFDRGLSQAGEKLPDLLTMTQADIAERHREAEPDLSATDKAADILRKGGPNAYEKALRVLRADSRDWWQN